MFKIRMTAPPSPDRSRPCDPRIIAPWLLAQAARGLPHCVSRLDVLILAAELAQDLDRSVLFVDGNGGEHGPGAVLEMLGRGEDPRPRE